MSTLSCWDCSYFKAHGLCCPKHGTPEEKAAAEREALNRIANGMAEIAKIWKKGGE